MSYWCRFHETYHYERCGWARAVRTADLAFKLLVVAAIVGVLGFSYAVNQGWLP